MTTPELDNDVRSRNQQRIDALREQVTARREDYREDTNDELAHDRGKIAEQDYHRDDDEQLDEDTDFYSGERMRQHEVFEYDASGH